MLQDQALTTQGRTALVLSMYPREHAQASEGGSGGPVVVVFELQRQALLEKRLRARVIAAPERAFAEQCKCPIRVRPITDRAS